MDYTAKKGKPSYKMQNEIFPATQNKTKRGTMAKDLFAPEKMNGDVGKTTSYAKGKTMLSLDKPIPSYRKDNTIDASKQ